MRQLSQGLMARKDGETAGEIPLTGRGGRPSVWHLSGIARLRLSSRPRRIYLILLSSLCGSAYLCPVRISPLRRDLSPKETPIRARPLRRKKDLPLTRAIIIATRFSRFYSRDRTARPSDFRHGWIFRRKASFSTSSRLGFMYGKKSQFAQSNRKQMKIR